MSRTFGHLSRCLKTIVYNGFDVFKTVFLFKIEIKII